MVDEPSLGPFATHTGLTISIDEAGLPVLRLEVEKKHENLVGVAHGGAIFTLGDTAMGALLHLSGETGGEVYLSTDVHVRFLRPGAGVLVARPKVEGRTRSTRILSCRIERESDGEPVALMTAHFRRAGRDAGS